MVEVAERGQSAKSRIIEAAKEMFFARGFSKVKVDEIAESLGMSKKTIYSCFKSKDKLLDAVLEWNLAEVYRKKEEIMNSSAGYMDKLYGIFSLITDTVSQISPKFMADLGRDRPDLWKKIEEFRRKNIISTFSKLIDEGIGMGMIRKDVEKDIFILVLLNSVRGIINPETLSRHSLTGAKAFNGITRIVFDGILTDAAKSRSKALFVSSGAR